MTPGPEGDGPQPLPTSEEQKESEAPYKEWEKGQEEPGEHPKGDD